MKKTFTKFNEIYVKAFQKSRLLTQIFAFSMAIVIFLNFFDLIYRLNTFEGEISLDLWLSVKTDLIVLFTTASLFGIRFFLLFSKSQISFWISQFVWVSTIFFIHSQIVPNMVCTKNMLPAFSETIALLLMSYLLFSPIRQILTLVSSISIYLQKSGE